MSEAFPGDTATREEQPVTDVAVQVLIWVLIGAILLILVVAMAIVAKSLLALLAGATTLFAVIAVALAVYLGVRVMHLEERVVELEKARR